MSLRILCVEDDKNIARYLKELLMREGYDLWIAGTVSKGLEFARSEAFVLFLLDNGLPDGTGLALCRMIRDFNKHTPILFYSASYDPALRRLALGAGAQGYVNKRAGFDILKATIEMLIGNCSGDTIVKDQKEARLQNLQDRPDPLVEISAEVQSSTTAMTESQGELGHESKQDSEADLNSTFRNWVFDAKTTGLMVFGMMVTNGMEMAPIYADAARRAGASWKELYTVADLASAVTALKRVKPGVAMVNELRERDTKAGLEGSEV